MSVRRMFRGWAFGRLVVLNVVALLAACSSERRTQESTGRVAQQLSSAGPGWYNLAGHAYGQAVSSRGASPVILDIWSTGIGSSALWRDTYTPPTWTGGIQKNAGPSGGVIGTPAVAATATGATIVGKDHNNKIWWTQWTSAGDTFSCPPPGTGCSNSVWAQVGPTAGNCHGSPAVLMEGSDIYVYMRGASNDTIWMTRFAAAAQTWSSWT